MVDITKLDMTDIWASSGDKTAPDPSKIATGWIVEAVPRQWWNWFENRQDQNIAYMLQKGIPEWDAFTEYLTNKSYVQRNNVVYKCIQTATNQDPATAPLYWVKAFPESSAALEAVRVLTPAIDKIAIYTGTDTAELITVTPFTRTLLDDPNVTTWRATLGAAASHPSLTALSSVTGANNLLPYFTASSAMAVTSFTAFARTLLDDADAATARATLGVDSATDVTAALAAGLATKQPLDATLTALAGTTTANNTINYWTGVDTTSTTPLTVFARTLLDDADAATMRTTLSVSSAADTAANLAAGLATKQDLDATLTALAGLATGVNQLPYSTGADTFAQTTLTAFARTILDDADAVTVRGTIGADDAANLTTGTLPLARLPADLVGKNAATATALQTPRTIQGVSFNGTANITLSVVDKDSSVGSATLPAGTTAQRTASPVNGQLRYNSDNNEFEGYINGSWGGIGGGTPLFTVLWWPSRTAIPAGYVAADGQLLTRTTYSAAWARVDIGDVPVVADAAWLASSTNRGAYTPGNGTTTFRIPDLNGKAVGTLAAPFLRGDGTNSTGIAGNFQGSENLSHAHLPTRPAFMSNEYPNNQGGFTSGSVPSYAGQGLAMGSTGASGGVEARPVNVTGVYVIKLIGGASDLTQEDASIAIAALETKLQYVGGRNRIINGDARVAQRAAVSFTNNLSGYGGPDRFFAINSGAGGAFTQAAGAITVDGAPKLSIKQTVTSPLTTSTGASTWSGIVQILEGTNCYDMLGKPATVSFNFLSNVTGNFSLSLRDTAGTQSYVTSFAAVADVVQRVEFTFTNLPLALDLAADNQAALRLQIGSYTTGTGVAPSMNGWVVGNYTTASGIVNWAGTNGNYISATDIQLEMGTVATEFERIDYATLRNSCQRYFQSLNNYVYYTMYAGGGGTGFVNRLLFPTSFRATPTMTQSGLSSSNVSSSSVSADSSDAFRVAFTNTSPGNVVHAIALITASAELT